MVKKKGVRLCKVCKKVLTKKAVKSRSKKREKLGIKATKKNVCEFC